MAETITMKKQTVENNPSTGSQTVTVASKLPFKLEMKLYEFRKESETVHGQYKEYKKAYPKRGSPTYLIEGQAYKNILGDNGKQIEAGYALTHNIPKAFWDEWYEQNKEGDFIVNGMIFANVDMRAVRDEAHEKESLKSNIDRIDPRDKVRIGKVTIEKADRTGI